MSIEGAGLPSAPASRSHFLALFTARLNSVVNNDLQKMSTTLKLRIFVGDLCSVSR